MKRRCPNCGSDKVARILWGMPTFDEELMELESRGKVFFGGCTVMMPERKHHCNECEYHFGGEVIDFYGKLRSFELQLISFTSISFKVTYSDGVLTFMNKKTEKSRELKLTADEENKIVRKLELCHISEWEDYNNPEIMNGSYWESKAHYEKQNFYSHGTNKFAPYFEKMLNVFISAGFSELNDVKVFVNSTRENY